MRKIQSFLLIPLKKSSPMFRFASILDKNYERKEKLICLEFNNKNFFAKISKKKAEKIEKEKEKAKTEVPEEIDLTSFENNLKAEVENYRVYLIIISRFYKNTKTKINHRMKLQN